MVWRMHALSLKAVFCLMFTFVSTTALAQQLIRGKVTDEKGEAVVGASALIKGTQKGATTDVNGTFVIENLISGTYTVVVSYIGFTTREVKVAVPGSETLTIKLEESAANLEEVVVTGLFDKRTRMEASVAISTISGAEVAKQAPVSAADLLKNVPGVYVNSSLGEIRNTVYSRGVAAGSTDGANGYYYVSMQEDGLPVTNTTFTNYGPDFFLRADATVSRLEAVRGGTASILGANAPGGIFNYIMKEGGDKLEGEVRARYGLEGNGHNSFYRADVNVGGPLGKNWSWDAGGFYRYDEGHWYPGYPLNKGGQLRANVVKKYATGSVKLYAKYLNDRNGWQQFLPTVDFQSPKILDGFNNYTSLAGPALQQDFSVNQTGRSETFNSVDQTYNKDKSIGGTWEQRLGGRWTLNNAIRYSDKSSTWNTAIHANPLQMNSLIAYVLLGTLGQPGNYSFNSRSTGAQLLQVNSLTGYDFTVTGGATPGSNWVPNAFLYIPLLYNNQEVKEVLDQFSLTKRLKNMSFVIGGFYGHTSIDKTSGIIGSGLGLIQDRPELVSATRMNPNGTITQLTNPNGLMNIGGGLSINKATQNQLAFFLGNTWQASPALNVDWGIRLDHINVSGQNTPGVTTQSTTGGIDGNPLTFYDNTIGSAPQSFGFNKSISTFSYSVGANYKINNNFAIYGRVSQGKKAPDLDLYFGATSDFLAQGLNPIAQRLFQVEGGVKVKSGTLNLFVTPFYSELSNVPNVQWFRNADNSSYFSPALFNKFRTVGVELEGDYQLNKHFNLRGVFTLQKGTAVSYSTWLGRNPGAADDSLVSYSGTEQDNLPRTMLNITPSYTLGKFSAQLTWSFMGRRQANAANAFQLPSFSQFNFSTGYDVSKRLTIGLIVNNIFNTYGIMLWSRPGDIVESLDRQGFTKEVYEQNKNRVYTSSSIPPRAYFLNATFRF